MAGGRSLRSSTEQVAAKIEKSAARRVLSVSIGATCFGGAAFHMNGLSIIRAIPDFSDQRFSGCAGSRFINGTHTAQAADGHMAGDGGTMGGAERAGSGQGAGGVGRWTSGQGNGRWQLWRQLRSRAV
eukprot:scaffold4967_cov116-Isochrysis_galbana.AAC.13